MFSESIFKKPLFLFKGVLPLMLNRLIIDFFSPPSTCPPPCYRFFVLQSLCWLPHATIKMASTVHPHYNSSSPISHCLILIFHQTNCDQHGVLSLHAAQFVFLQCQSSEPVV